jgi:hypothetical protein
MGFWDNLARDVQAQRGQQQAPSQEQQVAPGAWWQQSAVQPQPRAPLPQYQQPPPPQQQVDLCPRCSSDNYGEFQMDVSYGGTVPPQVGAVRKQCFDCRYPMYNATGDLITGRGIQAGTKLQAKNVRQLGDPRQGSTTIDSLFDNAMHVPGA